MCADAQTVLERAESLTRDESYIDIPIYRLLGRDWIEDQAMRAALRQLRRAGLLTAADSPGFVRLG